MSKYPTGGIKTFKDGHEEYWCEYCRKKYTDIDNTNIGTWNGKIICLKCENSRQNIVLLEQNDKWGIVNPRLFHLLGKYTRSNKKNNKSCFYMDEYGNTSLIPNFKEFVFMVSYLCHKLTYGDFIQGRICDISVHKNKTDDDFINNFVSVYKLVAEKDGYRFGDIKP